MKKFLAVSAFVLVLAACGNGDGQAEEHELEEEHESYDGSESHSHDSDLEMAMNLDNGPEPSVVIVELVMDDEPYEADRVRLEVVNESDAEDVEWIDAEAQEAGIYTAELEDVEEGAHNIILHVNGPDDLHDHIDEVFEVN
jgi:hypothetical protein